MAIRVLPVPARPSRATTLTSGSSSSSSAKRCSLERARRPHASGAAWPSSTSSPSLQRASADCEPQRRTTNSFSCRARGAVDVVDGDRAVAVQRVDQAVPGGILGHLHRRPARRAGDLAATDRVVLERLHAHVRGLDPQGGVVGHHARRGLRGLAERGADDPVVRHRRVEAVLDEQVLLDAVDLDPQRGRGRPSRRRRPARRATRRRGRAGPRSSRSAVRAARPTSSSRVFRLSSSSITVSGMTTSTLTRSWRCTPGSATRTDVSSTTLVRRARRLLTPSVDAHFRGGRERDRSTELRFYRAARVDGQVVVPAGGPMVDRLTAIIARWSQRRGVRPRRAARRRVLRNIDTRL